MAFFSFDKKGRLGIDIGTASIKVVELAKESNRFNLTNYGTFEIEPDESALNVVKLSNKDLVSGIQEVLQKAHMKSRDVIASIPSFPTFSTTITMPYLSEDEVAKAIPFEARKYIPIPLSEVQLDWAIVNVRKDQRPGIVSQDPKSQPNIEVFLVAVPKEEVSRYQTIMKDAGLNLKALELENFALTRALVGNDLSPIAIINIGGRSTSILVVENGFQRASHDYEVGGFAITKSISRALGVNLRRAEELKRNFGIRSGDDNIIRQAMSSLVDMMAFEANKTIHNYEDQRKTKITKILVVGGLANMPSFIEYFSEKLGRPVSSGNSLARVILPPELESLRTELNSTFVVSIGLAMRDI
ncbi:MAG: type IV pilus assembly protein PilM [Patescibacteria group bacterium]